MRNAIEFGSGLGTQFAFPAALLLVAGAACLLFLPRKYAIAGLFVPVFLIPMSQRLVFGGLDLYSLRLLVAVGLVRVFAASIGGGLGLKPVTPIERALVWYAVAGATTFALLWMTPPAFLNRFGVVYNLLGTYLLVRFLVRDSEDVDRVLKLLAGICVLLAGLMTLEQLSGRNPLAVLGAVEHPWVRDGRFRAQASFGHAILAGTFGATLFPLFLGLVGRPAGSTLLGIAGALGALMMVGLSTSSTPLLALLAAVVALCAWPVRGQTYYIKRAAIVMLVGLHLVMKAPVWALILRASSVGGGTGYHRYQLVDQAINRFGEWWLLGTKNSGAWGFDMWDTANEYVEAGLTGGVISLLLFLLLLRRGFVALSKLRAAAGSKADEWRAWTFTAALFTHAVAFFGISYFDQTLVLWLGFLAMIVALTTSVRAGLPGEAGVYPEIGMHKWVQRVPRQSMHVSLS